MKIIHFVAQEYNFSFILRNPLIFYRVFSPDSCNLHTHLYFPRLHDRLDVVCGCRNRELFREQRHRFAHSRSEAMVRFCFFNERCNED